MPRRPWSMMHYHDTFESFEHLLCIWAIDVQALLGPKARELAFLGSSSTDLRSCFQAAARIAGCASWFAIWKYEAFERSVTPAELMKRVFS